MTSKEALEILYPQKSYLPYHSRHEKRYACMVIEKDLKLLELIKKTCIITIREIQGDYYLFIGNSIKGAKPLTKEEMEIMRNYETKRTEIKED